MTERERPVPAYVVTGARSQPTRNTLRPETLLIARVDPGVWGVHGGRLAPEPTPERIALVAWCRRPLSVAEAAVHMQRPISVVAVLASELIDVGYLESRSTMSAPSPELLKAVLDGLNRL